MGTEVCSVNLYMKNAYSQNAKFDISHGSGVWKVCTPQRRESDPAINMSKTPPETWELDVCPLIGSKKWLHNYGLKKNRLTLVHLLPQIGFKLSDDFDRQLKSPISSRYGGGLFSKVLRPDGKTFNITGSKEKLHQIKKRLTQAINLFRRRLEWLTTESRRIFGVIEEKSVTIIMDIKNMSPQQFDQYRVALERVLREQVMQLAKFNIIRASEDMDMYNPQCVPVTHDTVENAIQWMWNLDRLAAVSNTATCEAVLRALNDKNNEAIYLFTEGTSVDSSRELLKEKIVSAELKLPIHIVSFNCDSSDTIKFLRDFTKVTGGRFHAYAVVMEMDAYESQPVDTLTNKANIVLKKKTYGGLPSGVGVREDIVLIFEELEEARNTLSQIQVLIEQAPEPKSFVLKTETPQQREKTEACLSSREWLEKYGLSAQRLGLYHVLAGVAFKHQDGVVELMDPPPQDTQTNAIPRPKLVHARYCEQFPVVHWKDGSVVHVQVTPEVHRSYEKKMEVALNKIQQRADWLQQGSRALFGSIIEDQIYILIDTSASMQPSIQFVKDKLFVLMQEQLRHKAKFNLVSFNSKSTVWRDRLVHINESNLQEAWAWVQGLSCWGSTNTYAAIQQAMSDPQTEAIYLLTDGRPDQPPKSILAQVQMRNKVPIHAISFNCNDIEANRFLFELARVTGGRYHSYSEDGDDNEPTDDQPETYESEDIYLLHKEIKQGLENLDQLAKLRDECSAMAWRREIDALKKCSKDHTLSDGDRVSAVPALEPTDLYRPNSPISRPQSAPPQGPRHIPTPPPRPSSSHGFRRSSSERRTSVRPHSARHRHHRPLIASSSKKKSKPKPLVQGHTKTSLLRTLNSSGRFTSSEWLLPETKQLFQTQAQRQQKLQEHDEKRNSCRKFRNNRLLRANELSSKQWLSKFGLVAKRLTILDALSPTFIPHKSTYVQILDKHVVSRVFDEILPLAHVSNRKRNEIRLINPSGVNLKSYEEKLQQAIDLYKRRLDQIVWDVLPEHVKNEYENNGPVSFLNNREHLMKALDEANWPIREQEITLMEEEIGRALSFLQQSKDLRREASDDFVDDRGSVTPTSQARTTARDDEAVSQSAKDESKERENKSTEKSVRLVLETLRNQQVIARNKDDGLYHPGVVKSCCSPRFAVVMDKATGIERSIPTRFIIPIRGAIAVPELHAGDCVLVRVLNLESEIECYVPGVVQFPPRRESQHPAFYSVTLYNEQKVTTMRKNLVKISQERYNLGVNYICRIHSDNELHYRPSNPTPPISEDEDNDKDTRNDKDSDWEREQEQLRQNLEEKEEENLGWKQEAEELKRQIKEKQDLENELQQKTEGWKQEAEELKRQLKEKQDLENELQQKTEGWKQEAEELKRQLKERQDLENELQQKSEDLRRKTKKLKRQLKKKEDVQKESQQMNEGWKQEAEELKRQLKERQDQENELQQKSEQWKEKALYLQKQLEEQQMKRQNLDVSEKDAASITPRPVIEDIALEHEQVTQSPWLELRKSLPKVKVKEEVLAKWPDDCWYYKGTILSCDNCLYQVEDSTGDVEQIWRNDIITDEDDDKNIIQVNDYVVAAYPGYSSSYAPGQVVRVFSDLSMQVRFYDSKEGTVFRDQVFKLSEDKYRYDVEDIRRCENRWVGRAAVVRNDDTGVYELANIKEKDCVGQNYTIEWPDCSHSPKSQNPIHIFGAFTRHPPLKKNGYVLAIANDKTMEYLPGQVTHIHKSKDSFDVAFCDGTVKKIPLDRNLYYCLNKTYYDQAVTYFLDMKERRRCDSF
ncbi:von Willebrand factor A domain-containing protein 3B-like isoform X3 [Gigantopelta aegis]|uniref:von Willebrand factor A domain-containing protein 3B-like isoform X3 n=1 Tax=Gigantopelta aegis TaxID=1735272 RepID=UPI001B88A867|nr:von Willebrand factor A domain-containing protein 3B-like isoform X3 [Gigantopelta aegis]